jgi:hypothetical protein
MVRICRRHEREENCLPNGGYKPERKRPLGRRMRRGENIVEIYLKQIKWRMVDWIHLVQDREQHCNFVNVVMKLRVL